MNKKYTEKILLIDDDGKNLQIAMNILKDYNVIFAQSGEKALSLLEENDFDLILLDVIMPTMTGFEVCEKIKQNKKLKSIPVIFLTVKDEEKDIVRGFELGAVDYITKPFFPDVLLQRVNTHLKLRNTMKKLENINSNLNNIVDDQILQIRQKDELINKQATISAINEVIDLICLQWKVPLDKLKLYLQSLSIESNKENNVFDIALEELNKLNKIMNDFHKFFEYKKSKEQINIKVVIDNAIINIKDELSEKNINVKFDGDILLTLNIIMDELYHIFINLLEFSLSNSDGSGEKNINIGVEENENSIFITYEDNIKVLSQEAMLNLFEIQEDDSSKTFNLAFYLIKIFVEKNKGTISTESTQNGLKYFIKFAK